MRRWSKRFAEDAQRQILSDPAQRNNDWCILRCSGGNTIRLAQSLTEAGIEAWTPIEVRDRRAGKDRKLVEQANPLTPSIVFARADRMPELIALARSPSLNYRIWDSEKRRMVTKGHPYFSVFKDANGYGVVSDSDLTSLRHFEQVAADLTERRRRVGKKGEFQRLLGTYKAGDSVKVTSGPFEGLTGIVETTAGKYLMVVIEQFGLPVKIAPWHLPSILLDDDGAASQAA